MLTSSQPQIQLKSPLLPVLFAAALALQLIEPYKGWTILLVGLGLVWLISFLWARSLAQNLRLRREMRFGWAQVGDQMEERFTLENQGWFPALWVEVLDRSNMPGYRASRATGVEGSSSNSWHTSSLCKRRGLYTLGPTDLRTGDPFGIYTVHLHNPASTTLMVMPPVIPLPSIEVAPGGRTGEARPRSNAPERTVSASSVREWAPGDSLRWIHWRTSARKETPFVRVFDGTPAGDWWILLDVDRSAQIGEGWESTTEHSIVLAASLADHGLRMKRAVGLVAGGQELVWLPPDDAKDHRWAILRALALIEAGEHPLAEMLERAAPAIGPRSSLVVITPNTSTEWVKPLIHLIWRGAVPTVLLLNPDTFPQTGREEGRSTAAILSLLAEQAVSRYLIGRDLLDRPEARPGQEGSWEWKIMPTGRAVPIRRPTNVNWKTF